MTGSLPETPIQLLKGVGPRKADALAQELGVYSFRDLLLHFPFRYIDRTLFGKVSDLNPDSHAVQLKGRITHFEVHGSKRSQRLSAMFSDMTGQVELVWFQGVKWIKPILEKDKEFVIFGKPTFFKGKMNLAHPELESLNSFNQKQIQGLQPVYASTEKLGSLGLHSKGLEKLLRGLCIILKGKLDESLSKEIISKHQLISRNQALMQIHFPSDFDEAHKARYRLKFEELFFLQLQLIKTKTIRLNKLKGFSFSIVGDFFNDFYHNHLPFELTNAQKKVIKEIRLDMQGGAQMNRLLQGDVGSGKTIVALMSMLVALDNGFQCALMAPTEILANQHFESINELLRNSTVEVGLLTGSTKKSQRNVLFPKLENNEIQILIGTHALIEDPVVFNNLGLVVIDEQHKFGVAQRARLWKKNDRGIPHILVMTATPIPRTLAMTFYGDLDVSIIDELPPGRKEISTAHRFDSARLRVFGFLKEQLKLGRQAYIVYPLINESESLDYKDLTDGYESICRAFPLPEYKVSVVHGQMKPANKDYEMKMFAEGKTNILVATTVIEVGVNVPNASVMIIESAERFGLSQLHQLRGRVGRGADQSYCILITGVKLSAEGKQRMKTMVETTDGFKIAETDMKMRGPGEIMGTRQSGMLNFKIADLTKDERILNISRRAAIDLIENDPELTQKTNFPILEKYKRIAGSKSNWSLIS